MIAGDAVLLVYNDYDGDDAAALNDWYARHHLAERVGPLPGFNRARRYDALGESPRFVALYELADGAALTTKAYKSLPRSGATDVTFIGKFSGHAKGLYVRRKYRGAGDGAFLGFLTCHAAQMGAGDPELLVDRIYDTVGVVSVALLNLDVDTKPAKPTQHGRESQQPASTLVLVEAMDSSILDELRSGLLRPPNLLECGLGREDRYGAYRLLHGLEARDG